MNEVIFYNGKTLCLSCNVSFKSTIFKGLGLFFKLKRSVHQKLTVISKPYFEMGFLGSDRIHVEEAHLFEQETDCILQ